MINLLAAASQGDHELLIKDGATKYYVSSFALWDGDLPPASLPDGTEGEPEFIFRFKLSGEFVMDHVGELPVYYSDTAKMYGVVVRDKDGYTVYTGRIIEKWSPDHNRYIDFQEEPEADGELQEYLQDGHTEAFIDYLRRLSAGESGHTAGWF
ncbi:MAG: hypothetical protein LUF87_08300 [Alistipes sp.]|nr:hypothetical protein [Alistipes sp.]